VIRVWRHESTFSRGQVEVMLFGLNGFFLITWLLRFEYRFDFRQSYNEHQRVKRTRVESPRFIEGFGFLRHRVHQNCSYTSNLRRLEDSAKCIVQKGASNSLSLPFSVNDKTTNYDNWNWIGHVAPNPSRHFFCCDGTCCQTVITNDLTSIRSANHISAGSSASLILQGTLLEPVIKDNLS